MFYCRAFENVVEIFLDYDIRLPTACRVCNLLFDQFYSRQFAVGDSRLGDYAHGDYRRIRFNL